MTLHRYMLNRRLYEVLPLRGLSLEVGNGLRRRGIDTGASVTLDIDPSRSPTWVGDATNMVMFADGDFDSVLCCETLQYVWWPQRAIREIHRVLVKGGQFILSIPFQRLPHKEDKGDHLYRWPEAHARDLLQDNGFAVERLQPLWPPWHYYTSGWFIEARAV